MGLSNMLQALRYGRPVVVVSGLPRSGTSMTMRMLEAGGMQLMTDSKRVADEDNPKGYFEVERVMDLAAEQDKQWLRDARGKAIKVISYLLPQLPGDLRYRVVFMNREFSEVLASQAKMLARRDEPSETTDDQMIKLYKEHLERVRITIRLAPHISCLDVGYRAVLEDPQTQAQRIADFLDAGLDVDAMAAQVDPSLYRNRSK
ncbi:MAG: sulfotransferase [bacterium]|nr:sulfotransferase [bacterium]